jgi:glycosyltransferase involved in cell wall biosynthesis
MRCENVVCFAKDWDGHPTSNTHVMRELARRGNRVLWLSSIGMRAPSARSARDLRRIGRKVQGFLAGPREVEPQLWVASPLAVPLPHAPWAVAANRRLLQATVRRWTRRLGMARFQLWTFLPNVVDYVSDLQPELVVYYCVDAWAHSSTHDGLRLAVDEARLCARADLVFATSRALVAARREWNPRATLAEHGVDHAHLARALDASLPVAPEVAELRRPVLAVVGLLDDRLDLAWLAALAQARPDWTLALVGPVHADLSRLTWLPNVRLLGPVSHGRLPALLKGCAAGLVPFVLNDYTRHIDPIKVREYLSAGLPVVATPLPETRHLGPWVTVARTGDEAARALDDVLAQDGAAARARRSAAMADATWSRRVDLLAERIAALREGRAAA